MFDDIGDDTETIGNNILGIIQIIGTLVSVGAIMILGIKYMVGSTEERAEYKKSMIPYIIGAVILFAAVNIANAIYDVVSEVDKPGTSAQIEQNTSYYIARKSY